MLTSILDNIKLERAKFSRDVEYLTESYLEDEVDDICEAAEEQILGTFETSDMLLEAAADLEKLSAEDDEFSNEEVNRIMEATQDMTFDEMIGVENYIEKV